MTAAAPTPQNAQDAQADPGQFRIHVTDRGAQLPPDLYLFVSADDTPEAIESFLIGAGHLFGGQGGAHPHYQMFVNGVTLIRDLPLGQQGVVDGTEVTVDPKATQGVR